MIKITDHINANMAAEDEPLQPWQLQAMLWSHWNKNALTYPEAMDRFFEAVPGQWENYPPKDLREVRPMTREAYRTAKMICELTDPVKRNALRYVIRAMLPKAKRKGHSPELSGV